jgi:hypothetical protein
VTLCHNSVLFWTVFTEFQRIPHLFGATNRSPTAQRACSQSGGPAAGVTAANAIRYLEVQ